MQTQHRQPALPQRSALTHPQLWRWTKPNGELKDMTCRVALLRMQADGLITLPPSRIDIVRKRANFAPTAASDAQTPIKQPVHEIGRITLKVVSGTTASRLWNEYVAHYHYLGYTPMSLRLKNYRNGYVCWQAGGELKFGQKGLELLNPG